MIKKPVTHSCDGPNPNMKTNNYSTAEKSAGACCLRLKAVTRNVTTDFGVTALEPL
jgi:hypothetical protein